MRRRPEREGRYYTTLPNGDGRRLGRQNAYTRQRSLKPERSRSRRGSRPAHSPRSQRAAPSTQAATPEPAATAPPVENERAPLNGGLSPMTLEGLLSVLSRYPEVAEELIGICPAFLEVLRQTEAHTSLQALDSNLLELVWRGVETLVAQGTFPTGETGLLLPLKRSLPAKPQPDREKNYADVAWSTPQQRSTLALQAFSVFSGRVQERLRKTKQERIALATIPSGVELSGQTLAVLSRHGVQLPYTSWKSVITQGKHQKLILRPLEAVGIVRIFQFLRALETHTASGLYKRQTPCCCELPETAHRGIEPPKDFPYTTFSEEAVSHGCYDFESGAGRVSAVPSSSHTSHENGPDLSSVLGHQCTGCAKQFRTAALKAAHIKEHLHTIKYFQTEPLRRPPYRVEWTLSHFLGGERPLHTFPQWIAAVLPKPPEQHYRRALNTPTTTTTATTDRPPPVEHTVPNALDGLPLPAATTLPHVAVSVLYSSTLTGRLAAQRAILTSLAQAETVLGGTAFSSRHHAQHAADSCVVSSSLTAVLAQRLERSSTALGLRRFRSGTHLTEGRAAAPPAATKATLFSSYLQSVPFDSEAVLHGCRFCGEPLSVEMARHEPIFTKSCLVFDADLPVPCATALDVNNTDHCAFCEPPDTEAEGSFSSYPNGVVASGQCHSSGTTALSLQQYPSRVSLPLRNRAPGLALGTSLLPYALRSALVLRCTSLAASGVDHKENEEDPEEDRGVPPCARKFPPQVAVVHSACSDAFCASVLDVVVGAPTSGSKMEEEDVFSFHASSSLNSSKDIGVGDDEAFRGRQPPPSPPESRRAWLDPGLLYRTTGRRF